MFIKQLVSINIFKSGLKSKFVKMSEEVTFPNHIGIIIDGNRRFAKKLMLKPWQGHEMGAKKLEKVLEWCQESNIKQLTIYGLSVENLSRPKEELSHLMKIFKDTFEKYINDPKIEQMMIDKMLRLMEENEAPEEQYLRIGLPVPSAAAS